MSLPSMLLKRLKKRGIVKTGLEKQKIEVEEIIAEDYDEVEEPPQYDHEPIKKPQENFWKERMKRRILEGNNAGYKSCPNKNNIYHKCSTYCVTQWGDGIIEPDRNYMKRRQLLLKKYSLPKFWQECYDCGFGVYYYWNTQSDLVSWLPPTHPKAVVSKSAATLRKELEESQPPSIEEHDELTEDDIEQILNAPLVPAKRTLSPTPDYQQSVVKKSKSRDLDKAIRQKHRKRESDRHGSRKAKEDDPLDPMDPASYSDVPRGKWSDGLIESGHKTGVDSTVSGTMFQQRPYPSPGDVLRANEKKSDY